MAAIKSDYGMIYEALSSDIVQFEGLKEKELGQVRAYFARPQVSTSIIE